MSLNLKIAQLAHLLFVQLLNRVLIVLLSQIQVFQNVQMAFEVQFLDLQNVVLYFLAVKFCIIHALPSRLAGPQSDVVVPVRRVKLLSLRDFQDRLEVQETLLVHLQV